MKKVLFPFFFFSLMVVGAQAQKSSCAKSCAAKPASASVSCVSKGSAASASETSMAAAKLASMDQTIETRTCPVSGTVSYVRKENGQNGSASFVDVNYDASTNTFVNVSPVKGESASNCGSKTKSASGKACCAGKGKATSTSSASAAEGKAVKASSAGQVN
jgi:hypothetical protein